MNPLGVKWYLVIKFFFWYWKQITNIGMFLQKSFRIISQKKKQLPNRQIMKLAKSGLHLDSTKSEISLEEYTLLHYKQ